LGKPVGVILRNLDDRQGGSKTHGAYKVVPVESISGRATAEGRSFSWGCYRGSNIRDGARRMVVPANAVWDDFFDAPGIDLPLREQPPA
jgi:hypothetical protein